MHKRLGDYRSKVTEKLQGRRNRHYAEGARDKVLADLTCLKLLVAIAAPGPTTR